MALIQRWEAAQETVVLSDLQHLIELNVVFILLVWKMGGKHDTAKVTPGSQ